MAPSDEEEESGTAKGSRLAPRWARKRPGPIGGGLPRAQPPGGPLPPSPAAPGAAPETGGDVGASVELTPEDREFVLDYLEQAEQAGRRRLGAPEGEELGGTPQGVVSWHEGTDMRSALTGRWQTFQAEFMRRGVEHHWDDEVYEWIEEQLDWWLAEADAASAGSGYTRPFDIVQGWKEFEKRAVRLNTDLLKARYMYVSLVNNKLGIGYHVEPHKDIAGSMEASREFFKSLHYVDVAKQIEELQDANPDGIGLTDVFAMMTDQVYNQDRDVVAVFDTSDDNQFGSVGIGKSDFLVQAGAALAPKTFDLRYCLAYSIDAVRFDRHMRLAMGKRLPRGFVWGHDEADNLLFDRDHGKGRNKSRVKRFLRVRKRNQMILLAGNSIWYLDNKMHPRITWRFRIVDRGHVEVYRTAGRRYMDESEDKWGIFVTEAGYPSLRAIRPDVRALYEACVEVVDEASARLQDEDDDEDVDELPSSPLDDLLKKDSKWGLDMLKEPYAATGTSSHPFTT